MCLNGCTKRDLNYLNKTNTFLVKDVSFIFFSKVRLSNIFIKIYPFIGHSYLIIFNTSIVFFLVSNTSIVDLYRPTQFHNFYFSIKNLYFCYVISLCKSGVMVDLSQSGVVDTKFSHTHTHT